MTLSISLIEGVIKPHNTSCSQVSLYSEKPHIEEKFDEFPYEALKEMATNFDAHFNQIDDSDYWKQRTIAYMLNEPSIISIAFNPVQNSNNDWLFLQKKIGTIEERVGFYAPYLLSEKEQKKWNAFTEVPSLDPSYVIENEALTNTLVEIGNSFFKDMDSCGLCLTFIDQNRITSVGWTKKI